MTRLVKNSLFAIVVAGPLVYVSSCSYLSHARQIAFESVEDGESKESVSQKLGSYTVETALGPPFLRYASRACVAPCAERWWLENRMAFDTEAWSVEFDKDGHVIRKVEWTSP